ncbi:MAG: HYR domain-containing protein, partial [Chloroflexi bacterium]
MSVRTTLRSALVSVLAVAGLVAGGSVAIAATTPTITAQIALPPYPQFLAVNSVTNRAYVAHLDDKISVVDLGTRSIVATIPTSAGLIGITLNQNTNQVYATSLRSSMLTIIDGATNSVQAVVPLPTTPLLPAVNPATGRVYVAGGGEVDAVSGTTVQRIFVAGAASITGVAVDPNNNRIFASDQTTNRVYVIDGNTNAVVAAIPVPAGTYTPLDVDVAGNRVFVVSSTDRMLSVIDATTNTIVGQTSFIGSPSGVAYEPGSDTIYVTNPGIAWLENVSGATYTRRTPLSFISIGNISHGIAVNTHTHVIYAIAPSFSGQMYLVEVSVVAVDTTAPQITAPANIATTTAPATCGRAVTFAFTASDDSGSVTVASAPQSGATFPKGTTSVTGTATDPSGNSATASFTVTVADTEPPTLTPPADLVVLATSATGADPGPLG